MLHNASQNLAANPMSWSSNSMATMPIVEEDLGDMDEPPDTANLFCKTPIPPPGQSHTSLLTQALQNQKGLAQASASVLGLKPILAPRSKTFSSTIISYHPKSKLHNAPNRSDLTFQEPELPKKKSISFACLTKPSRPVDARPSSPCPLQEKQASFSLTAINDGGEPVQFPRRPSCLKFVCPMPSRTSPTEISTVNSSRCSISSVSSQSSVSSIASQSSPHVGPMVVCISPERKYIIPSISDLQSDSTRFHEFASGEAHEEDWVRQGIPTNTKKLTIRDTLTKENNIRRLAEEVEDEEAAEGDDGNDALDGNATETGVDGYDQGDYEDENEDNDDEENDEDEDSDEGEGDEDNASDIDGFSQLSDDGLDTHDDSDSEFESDEERPQRPFWIMGSLSLQESRLARRGSLGPHPPELPDSTDFVCGTLDEDRHLEEAYINCMEARRREKQVVIPQDFDPNFPVDVDDTDEELGFEAGNPGSEDNPLFPVACRRAQGQHAERAVHSGSREDGRGRTSPRKLHPPPPQRRTRSPAPMGITKRMKSPRAASPAPSCMIRRSPLLGPQRTTKSLPRHHHSFLRSKNSKKQQQKMHNSRDSIHIRGAIDIVKGLEQRRQRRREKCHQEYCERARKGQIPERKTGAVAITGFANHWGADKMKEIGLLMAGKTETGDFVLSF